jgi:hypothetical protein
MAVTVTNPRLESASCTITAADGSTQDVLTTWSWFNPDLGARQYVTQTTSVNVETDTLDQVWWDGVYDAASDVFLATYAATAITAADPVTI